MPSGFTPNYGFELPATGEQDGLWGGTVNANMSALDTDLKAVSDVANAAIPNTANSVSSSNLASNSVTTAKIADLNVVTSKLADGAVTTIKITDLNVTTPKLADGAATTAKIADLNVTTGKLADAAVTLAKIQSVSTARILGRQTAGSGPLEELTAAQARSLLVMPYDGFLFGLTLSTPGSSTSFTVAVGKAADSTAAEVLVLSSALTKDTTGWGAGNNNGALDTGVIAGNTWYHVHLIRRSDTGVVDVLISLSATAPTLPSGYTQRRRIGALRTNGLGQWTAFSQLGDEFLWTSAVLDVDVSQTTTPASRTLSVPTGVQVHALMNVNHAGGGASAICVYSPDQSDQGASTTVAPLGVVGENTSAGGGDFGQIRVRTNTSAQVRTVASGTVGLRIATIGWIDRRGQD